MSISHFLSRLVCLGVAALPLVSRAAPATVDSVLERFVTASGGKAAIEKVASRHIVADLEAAGTPGNTNWQQFAKAPNKQATHVEIGGFGTIDDGFDGSTAWSRNQNDGLRVKEGDDLIRTRAEADIHRPLHFKTLYPNLSLKGTEKLDGQDVEVLESRPTATSRERFFFNPKSGLLVQQASEYAGTQGKVEITSRFDDYRAVDEVKYPHLQKITFNFGGQEFEVVLKIKEIHHGVTVPDSRFAKPAS